MTRILSVGSCAISTRRPIFSTLGVTPAEPGYAAVRVAPRLGPLSWARGKVPSPHGLISVEARRERLTIDSPVPSVLDLSGQPVRRLSQGRHELVLAALTT